ncbi:hypothetical protein BRADI_2g11646v3 [Brachypodium distachyon]|uniref:Uncharacterized protein n=1 Tax=Brachypodium distachyon TaxID=15368 RepID=A0A2K2D815_BRADI|nr:hypothetical protein BRADI_2g11646v3 [Brachypodium distachyon]
MAHIAAGDCPYRPRWLDATKGSRAPPPLGRRPRSGSRTRPARRSHACAPTAFSSSTSTLPVYSQRPPPPRPAEEGGSGVDATAGLRAYGTRALPHRRPGGVSEPMRGRAGEQSHRPCHR